MKENIDVIIPVKERYDLLLLALESINSQSLKPSKVWIVDDCSDELIDNFPKYSFKIKLLRNKKNKGPSYSCNLAAKKSNAKYIAILETDDLWKIKKLEKQYYIANKENLDFVYCNYLLNKKKNTQRFSNNKKKIFDLILKKWSCPNPSTFFFNRKSFLSLNGFDEKMIGSHDLDLWIRMTQSNFKIDFVNDYLVVIEDYNPNQMSRDYKTRIKSNLFFLSKYKDLIIKNKDYNFYKSYKKELLSRALIPCLKKTIKDKDILGLLITLKYLIVSKLFYKRIINLLFKF